MNGRLLILDQIQLHWISLPHILNVASAMIHTWLVHIFYVKMSHQWSCRNVSRSVRLGCLTIPVHQLLVWLCVSVNDASSCSLPSTLLRLHYEAVSVPLSLHFTPAVLQTSRCWSFHTLSPTPLLSATSRSVHLAFFFNSFWLLSG